MKNSIESSVEAADLVRTWRMFGKQYWDHYSMRLFILGWDEESFVDTWIDLRRRSYRKSNNIFGNWIQLVLRVPKSKY